MFFLCSLGFFFFVILGGWAAFAPLAQGTMAPGTVGPDGKRRTVQHLEGGIIRALRTRENEQVKQGDVLVVLEDVHSRSMLETYQSQLWAYLAEQARLMSEWHEEERIVFPQELVQETTPAALTAMERQSKIFTSRKETYKNEEKILTQSIRQIEMQIDGVKEENLSLETQKSLKAFLRLKT